ncbi:MAG TPA: hypothetical protein DEA08_38495, partial [Planctomycetes bacterium]|nr:hypothetical protein [Planctomycetota bacterium]
PAAPAAPAAAPAPPPPPPPAPAAAPVAAPAAPSAPSGADLTSVYKTLGSTWDALLQCADIIFQNEPHNPDSYSLRRFATWNKSKFSEIRQPEGGKLSFPGNKPGLLEKLDEQLANEEWQAVLQAAEPECSQRPFWVDPHYYVFRALEGLGKRYAAAATAVEGQARAFAASHPAALELRFSNDAPLASGPTKLWLSSSGGGGGEGGDGAGGVEGKLLAALGEARQQVLSGELGPAVETVRGALNGARGRRADFLLGLTLARLCLDGGRPELARSQLDRLASDCERYQLADWEPELAVQLLELRWRSLKDSPAEGEDPDALYSRLAALDLSAALALTDA